MYPDSPNNNPTNNPTDNPNPPLVRLQLDKLLVLENSSGKLQIYIIKLKINQSNKIGRIPMN